MDVLDLVPLIGVCSCRDGEEGHGESGEKHCGGSADLFLVVLRMVSSNRCLVYVSSRSYMASGSTLVE